MTEATDTRGIPRSTTCDSAQHAGTLLLSRSEVERMLTPELCIAAVEDAFRQHALGKTPAPGILGATRARQKLRKTRHWRGGTAFGDTYAEVHETPPTSTATSATGST
jgi:hypothetical protein